MGTKEKCWRGESASWHNEESHRLCSREQLKNNTQLRLSRRSEGVLNCRVYFEKY